MNLLPNNWETLDIEDLDNLRKELSNRVKSASEENAECLMLLQTTLLPQLNQIISLSSQDPSFSDQVSSAEKTVSKLLDMHLKKEDREAERLFNWMARGGDRINLDQCISAFTETNLPTLSKKSCRSIFDLNNVMGNNVTLEQFKIVIGDLRGVKKVYDKFDKSKIGLSVEDLFSAVEKLGIKMSSQDYNELQAKMKNRRADIFLTEFLSVCIDLRHKAEKNSLQISDEISYSGNENYGSRNENSGSNERVPTFQSPSRENRKRKRRKSIGANKGGARMKQPRDEEVPRRVEQPGAGSGVSNEDETDRQRGRQVKVTEIQSSAISSTSFKKVRFEP